MKKLYIKQTVLFGLIVIMFSGMAVAQYRSIDGIGNNTKQPTWGAVGTNQLQVVPFGYTDGISEPGGKNWPNPRTVSNVIFDQDEEIPSPSEYSGYTWVWGQFIDHDITLSPEDPTQPNNISIPIGDEYFDPNWTGTARIHTSRSAHDPLTGLNVNNPRQFPNGITAFIDASNVYGSDQHRSDWLRTFNDGKLKTSRGNMLPYNTMTGEYDADVDPNAPGMAMANPHLTKWFVAGDVRANENILLSSHHTIFMREHNRVCDLLVNANPDWEDEKIYQKARKFVGALLQSIVYEEWLPTLGVRLNKFTGYQSTVNPGIMNVFSTSAYRYGHTVVNTAIKRVDAQGNNHPQGNVTLFDAFFNPEMLVHGGGVDPLLRGLATQVAESFDAKMIGDLRNFLFGHPGSGGLDLAALNIQRGRERGLSDFNSCRVAFGMAPVQSFQDICSDTELCGKISDIYKDINNVDSYIGFLAEDHENNTLFGEVVLKIMKVQFGNLRDGDRYYYENDGGLSTEEIAEIKGTRLSHVIMRNSPIVGLQNNVFLASGGGPVGVDDFNTDGISMTVYPNPSYGNYTINAKIQNAEDAIVNVYNSEGKLILTKEEKFNKGMNNFEISILDYPEGQYNLVITQGEKVGVQKLIKE